MMMRSGSGPSLASAAKGQSNPPSRSSGCLPGVLHFQLGFDNPHAFNGHRPVIVSGAWYQLIKTLKVENRQKPTVIPLPFRKACLHGIESGFAEFALFSRQ